MMSHRESFWRGFELFVEGIVNDTIVVVHPRGLMAWSANEKPRCMLHVWR
jgi:hypothetical protein